MYTLNKFFVLFLLFSHLPLLAQVGVGSTNPKATLDIVASNMAQPQNTDGILIPRIQKLPDLNPTEHQHALLVYLTTQNGTYNPGFYYWDNPTLTWVKISTATDANLYWSLLGNAATDATNFIGTTTPQALQFKVNNTISGKIDHATPFNTSYGYSTLSKNTTGIHNNAMGFMSLASNTSGYWNTATGTNSLRNNTTGHNNTATGSDALLSNTVGLWNTAYGVSALKGNTTGRGNTASGFEALYTNTSGYWNTASGNDALFLNTTGSKNTAFGNGALQNNTTGSNNTALGSDSGPDTNLNNTTSIGYQAKATASNMVRIGNNDVSVIQGNVAWSTPSDGRIKKNVKEDVPGLAFINALRPVTYLIDTNAKNTIENNTAANTNMESSFDKIIQTGFIAQEVEQAAKKLNYSFDGVSKPSSENGLYAVSYATFVVPLVKAVQEQQKEIEQLKAENKRLKDLEIRLSRLEKAIIK